jgi:methionine synthase II (cobalamin-independent)
MPFEAVCARRPQRRAPAKQLFLNPDCGFGCFANRCVNTEETAAAKLRQMAGAARRLREKYG